MSNKQDQSPLDKKKSCGIVMPISACDGYSAQHWKNVLHILQEAISETKFEAELVSESDSMNIIQQTIVQNLYTNNIVICDVSTRKPNVMFELGLRLAFDKPTIIIKDDKTTYPFDVTTIKYLEYPKSLCYNDIQIFQNELKDKIEKTYEASLKDGYVSFLSNYGQFKIAHLNEKEVSANDICFE